MSRVGAHNGQTLGKQVLSIRVARHDGQPVTAATALIRDVLMKGVVIGGIGGLFLGIPPLLDGLWPLWDDQRQTWHDKVAATVVVAG
jgi:uncharacterized RDD family membrane protein YckC